MPLPEERLAEAKRVDRLLNIVLNDKGVRPMNVENRYKLHTDEELTELFEKAAPLQQQAQEVKRVHEAYENVRNAYRDVFDDDPDDVLSDYAKLIDLAIIPDFVNYPTGSEDAEAIHNANRMILENLKNEHHRDQYLMGLKDRMMNTDFSKLKSGRVEDILDFMQNHRLECELAMASDELSEALKGKLKPEEQKAWDSMMAENRKLFGSMKDMMSMANVVASDAFPLIQGTLFPKRMAKVTTAMQRADESLMGIGNDDNQDFQLDRAEFHTFRKLNDDLEGTGNSQEVFKRDAEQKNVDFQMNEIFGKDDRVLHLTLNARGGNDLKKIRNDYGFGGIFKKFVDPATGNCEGYERFPEGTSREDIVNFVKETGNNVVAFIPHEDASPEIIKLAWLPKNNQLDVSTPSDTAHTVRLTLSEISRTLGGTGRSDRDSKAFNAMADELQDVMKNLTGRESCEVLADKIQKLAEKAEDYYFEKVDQDQNKKRHTRFDCARRLRYCLMDLKGERHPILLEDQLKEDLEVKAYKMVWRQTERDRAKQNANLIVPLQENEGDPLAKENRARFYKDAHRFFSNNGKGAKAMEAVCYGKKQEQLHELVRKDGKDFCKAMDKALKADPVGKAEQKMRKELTIRTAADHRTIYNG